jgi:glycosyltransferase involved in cell wall biosynthesis
MLAFKDISRPFTNDSFIYEVGLRLIIVSEWLDAPLDEGAKKMTVAIIAAMRKYVDSLVLFSNSDIQLKDIQVKKLPSNKLLLAREFSHDLKNFCPDAILYIPSSLGTPASFIRSCLLKIQSGKKTVGILTLQQKKYPRWIFTLPLNKMIDIVFSQSLESVKFLSERGFNSHWIPGGVDTNLFKPVNLVNKKELKKKLGFGESDQIFLHVGHINKDRNVLMLAKLIKPGRRVVLVGSTSTKKDLSLMRELEKGGVRVVTEYIENIEQLYQAADCYVFPVETTTASIGVPLSVLEAMGCNLPVITTVFGGLPAMFAEGGGLIFMRDLDKLDKLANKIMDKQVYETRKMVEPFDWDAVARKILTLLP